MNKRIAVEGLFLVVVWSVTAVSSVILATAVAAVSGTLHASQDHIAGHPLAVLGQTQEAHQVDETCGEVELAAKLAGGVVVGKGVVIVVKPLTCEAQEDIYQNISTYLVEASSYSRHGLTVM